MIETIIQLPSNLFYNTSISTYIWIVTNKKRAERNGKILLIDASNFSTTLEMSLGNKLQKLSSSNILEITSLYESFQETRQKGQFVSRVFNNEDFGYRTITVNRPLRDMNKEIVLIKNGRKKGKPQADKSLKDTENIPLSESIESYFAKEVQPYYPDAWIEKEKTQIGYEISFNKYFYKHKQLRTLEEINLEIDKLTRLISKMI